MFAFNKIKQRRSLNEIADLIIKDYGKSYEGCVAEMKKGKFFSCKHLLLKYTYYYEDGDSVYFCFDDNKNVSGKIIDISMGCFFFNDSMDYSENLQYICDFIDIYNDEFKYTDCLIEENSVEDGQAKICCSTLLNMVQSDPEVHILVIGSSASGEAAQVSGRTYEVIQNFFVNAGYYGSMVCYDPCERNREIKRDTIYKNKKFEVSYRAEKFDYDKKIKSINGCDFTHILDDAWVPQITKRPIAFKGKIHAADVQLVDGKSKFSYAIRKEKRRNVLIVKNGLTGHKQLPGAIGGGLMIKKGNSVHIFGSSNRVGHFDKELLMIWLCSFDLIIDDNLLFGKFNLDPDSKLFKNYPNARISCKYFGEDFGVEGDVVKQIWYTGLERRFYYNFPDVEQGIYGCGCTKCLAYGLICANFKVYAGACTITENMIMSVVDDPHVSRSKSLFLKIRTYINSFSHADKNLCDLVNFVEKKFKCSQDIIFRCLTLMKRFGEINLKDNYFEQGYNNYVPHSSGDKRFYNDRKDYVKMVNGILVEKNFVSPLDYRVQDVVGDNIDDAVAYFFDKYKDLVSTVSGSELCGDGNLTLGITAYDQLEVTKSINKEIVMDVYKEFYLVINNSYEI